MNITPKQRQYLKGLAHHLKPVVQIGKEGLTPAVTASINAVLDKRELIKVQIQENADLDRKEGAQKIADDLKASLLQIVGRKVSLYRRNPALKKRITLPGEADHVVEEG